MNDGEFLTMVDIRLEQTHDLLLRKITEYRRDGLFSNFNKVAEIIGKTKETALVGMWMKHIVSIIDIVGDIEKGKDFALWQFVEKEMDSINYLLLLEAMLVERKEQRVIGFKPEWESADLTKTETSWGAR